MGNPSFTFGCYLPDQQTGMQEKRLMWLQLHDGDGFPLFVNMDNVVDFRWYEREGYTCLLTTAPVAEKLHRLYVRENAEKIMALLRAEQERMRGGSRGA